MPQECYKMLRKHYNHQLPLQMGTCIFISAMWQLAWFYIAEDSGLKKHHSCHLRTGKVPFESRPSQWHGANLFLVLVCSASGWKFPHHLCKHTCSPGELSAISAPCLREICLRANRTASPSAGPAAASWNSGSLCGREYYCKLWRAHTHRHGHMVNRMPSFLTSGPKSKLATYMCTMCLCGIWVIKSGGDMT